MNDQAYIKNENGTAAAFSRQAAVFDQLYANDTIIRYKRHRVRDHVLKYLPPQSTILEINAGTGDDAIFFAQKGHMVHATDISVAMQEKLMQKTKDEGLQMMIGNELCSFTALGKLSNRGPFDLVFSNFAGLNCTRDLGKVLQSLDELVKPGGMVTLVLLPKFCLWEFLLLFKFRFKTAFRRLSGEKGAKAHIEGEHFRCWYYNPSYIRKQLAASFSIISQEGLCVLTPPSYLAGFAEKYPKLYRFLVKKENAWKSGWPWKNIGDYYIISLRKNLL